MARRNDRLLNSSDYARSFLTRIFHEPKRRHSSLGYLSPVAFETINSNKDRLAA
jgi:transposase InsO family protein